MRAVSEAARDAGAFRVTLECGRQRADAHRLDERVGQRDTGRFYSMRSEVCSS